MKNYPLIIIPFTLPWDWSADFQRQTCLELSKRNIRVIAYMSDNAYFFLKENKNSYPTVKNITFYTPKYYIPLKRLYFINELNKYLSLLLFNLKYLLVNKLIWIFDPQFHYFPKFFQNKTSIYDCVDYFGNEQNNNEKRLINNVDKFFVNSRSLLSIHKGKKDEIFLVPQGFNLTDFEKQEKYLAPVKKHKKPVIGYVGGVNYRLDYKLLINLISKNNRWNFSFWGPIQNYPGEDLDKILKQVDILKKFPNTKFNVTKNKLELMNAINNFDIAIIPYDISQDFNLYCYPMKIFEYFYLGKPIISTSIKELQQNKFKELITTNNSYQGWENHIKRLLGKDWPRKYKNNQRILSIENSWAKKIDKIFAVLY